MYFITSLGAEENYLIMKEFYKIKFKINFKRTTNAAPDDPSYCEQLREGFLSKRRAAAAAPSPVS